MIERRSCSRFLDEAIQPARIGNELGGQNLERDMAIERGIKSVVNLSHASRAEERNDPVASDLSSGEIDCASHIGKRSF